MVNSKIDKYFFILFSIIPISIIIGPSVSLVNILLVDLSFIFLLFYKKDFTFLKSDTVRLILLLYLYLIFNSLISQNFSLGIARNFGFIRWAIFFIAFNYFFYNKFFFNKIFMIWTVLIAIMCFDVYFEIYFGKNILGYGGAEFGKRIVSFFKDEPIVGGYINAFYLIIVGYLYSQFKNYSRIYQITILIISLLLFLTILFTGERSNTIKAFLGILIFYSLFSNFNTKQKFFIFLAIITLLITSVLTSHNLKVRYLHQIFNFNTFSNSNNEIKVKENIFKENIFVKHEKNIYFIIYRSGLSIFKEYPILGVGNKNYRFKACEFSNDKSKKNSNQYLCTTHPHQTYVEFLSEHGLVGTMILFLIFYKLIFRQLKIVLKLGNYIQLGCIIYLMIIFIPLLPSGAFFSDFNSTFFWLNLSILYALNPKTNIFNKLTNKIN